MKKSPYNSDQFMEGFVHVHRRILGTGFNVGYLGIIQKCLKSSDETVFYIRIDKQTDTNINPMLAGKEMKLNLKVLETYQ